MKSRRIRDKQIIIQKNKGYSDEAESYRAGRMSNTSDGVSAARLPLPFDDFFPMEMRSRGTSEG